MQKPMEWSFWDGGRVINLALGHVVHIKADCTSVCGTASDSSAHVRRSNSAFKVRFSSRRILSLYALWWCGCRVSVQANISIFFSERRKYLGCETRQHKLSKKKAEQNWWRCLKSSGSVFGSVKLLSLPTNSWYLITSKLIVWLPDTLFKSWG